MQSTVKTGISIPRPLFKEAEELAREMKLSRSRLFALALEDYIRRQKNRALLAQINAAYTDGLTESEELSLRAAGVQFSRILEGDAEDIW